MVQLDSVSKGHSISRQVNIGGYDPILEVRISGDGVQTESIGVTARTMLQNPSNEAEIRPLCDGEAREHLDNQLANDDLFRWALGTRTILRGAHIPTFDRISKTAPLSSVSTIDSHPLLNIKGISGEEQPAAALIIDHLMRRHEIGSREQSGGHFTAIVDPETQVFGEYLPVAGVRNVLFGHDTSTPAVPRHYHEVRAILEHRDAYRRKDDVRSIISEILAQTRSKQQREEVREILKMSSLEKLTEIINEVEKTLKTKQHTEFDEIASYLQQQIGIDRALDLLAVPQEAVCNPNKWLCCLLHDLTKGKDPEKIREKGSFWEIANHENPQYDVVAGDTQKRREKIISDPSLRVRRSLHDVVSFTGDEKIRRWYAYKPSDEGINAQQLRFSLVCEAMYALLAKGGHTPLNDGINPGKINTENGEEEFHVAGHQKVDINPYEQAMSGETTTEKIKKYFDYDIDRQRSYKMWHKGRKNVAKEFNFNNVKSLVSWIEGSG